MPLSETHGGDGVCCGLLAGPFAGPSEGCASLSSFGKASRTPCPQLGHLYLSKVTLKACWNPSLDFPSTLKLLRRTRDDLSFFCGNVSRKPIATYWRSYWRPVRCTVPACRWSFSEGTCARQVCASCGGVSTSGGKLLRMRSSTNTSRLHEVHQQKEK